MPCFYPITAYRSAADGSIHFGEKYLPREGGVKELRLPCGQCDGCRIERSRQWAVRCMHEASMHEQNTFVTLTYNDDHLPSTGGLVYRDFQLFMKRLRKKFKERKIRFFACGEYGSLNERPHFHAIIFNLDFSDKVLFKMARTGEALYTSADLQSLWSSKGGDPIGFATCGSVTLNSASYVARYVMKKRTRGSANPFKTGIDLETGEVVINEQEFVRMSLKPGIGRAWYDKFKTDCFPEDFIVMNGKKMKPPKYYFKILSEEDEKMYDEIIDARADAAHEKRLDATPDRLAVREQCLKASLALQKREL